MNIKFNAEHQDSVVIADGPNYIKGYRYELHCISRSMKTQHLVIHVAASKTVSLASYLNFYRIFHIFHVH